jgi:hypothetical protein
MAVTSVSRQFKSLGMKLKWAGHVECMGENINKYINK